MKSFNLALVERITAEYNRDAAAATALTNLLQGMSKDYLNAAFGSDYSIREIGGKYSRATLELANAAAHAAWSKFFDEYDVYQRFNQQPYTSITAPYLFVGGSRARDTANNHQALTPFTETAARGFYDEHLRDTTERRVEVVRDMLNQCGADWSKRPARLTSRMTVRSLDAYSVATKTLGLFAELACYVAGIDFTWNEYYSTLRNNRTINGEAFALTEHITIEWRQNGNATMRIDPVIVGMLNNYVAKGE